MKNKIMENIGLKVLSIIVAFLFWIIIVNITDPTISKKFYHLPVEILNENVITSANQVYEIESGDHVDIIVRGKRSFIEKLSDSDFEATADLSELSKVNAVTVDIKLKKNVDSEYEIDADNAVLKVKLEKRETRKFKVEVESSGTVGENYELGEMTAKPNIVEVSCGQSKFKKIDRVAVIVPLNGETEDFERSYMPVLYDKNGDIIDSANVTFSNDSITVSTQVMLTKEISVIVKPIGKPASGYRLLETDFKPESIRVSGNADLLKKQNSITIPIQIDNAKNPVEKEVDASKYLPDGLFVVGDSSTISVRCNVQKNGSRSFVLVGTDIAVKNLPTDCTMRFLNEDAKYGVILTGKDEILENVSATDLGAFIDLKGYGQGQHSVDVQFQLPNGVKLKKKLTVTIVLAGPNGQGSNSPTEIPVQTTDVPEQQTGVTEQQ
ncbi:MAG: hypothetical protein J5972_07180 [Eubacterium sp.]|nr:hypothetical protein [Eubacterium sp.]